MYDISGAASDRNVVVLNDIHIDIMDYIVPAGCTDTEFRQMWAEFEWENKVGIQEIESHSTPRKIFHFWIFFFKVSVNTNLTDLHDYLQQLIKSTNMKCLTPDKALSGQCEFMAANMYARSIFGEDALANLSIEKCTNDPDCPVTGHIRIRAKSQVRIDNCKTVGIGIVKIIIRIFLQGMALSLGEKINITQKKQHKVSS